ncbi:MAG: hypothetical protein CME70_18690 [Halobacteriovorax sp.]|nr:hypothetical protein [Halobacteriovorax sp.]
MDGLKHTVECHCVLPQYKNKPERPWHKFVVFSVIDDSGTVEPKYAQCNNCGVIHKIIDICRSEIISGRDELRSITTVDDIKIAIPRDIRDILESYKVDLATWEYTRFFLENKKWGQSIVLTRDQMEDEIHGKMLVLEGPDTAKIESFSYSTFIGETL